MHVIAVHLHVLQLVHQSALQFARQFALQHLFAHLFANQLVLLLAIPAVTSVHRAADIVTSVVCSEPSKLVVQPRALAALQLATLAAAAELPLLAAVAACS